MKYYIYVCEDIYGGLHGMGSSCVIECDNDREAYEVGRDMGFELIDSYSELCDMYYSDDSDFDGEDIEESLQVYTYKINEPFQFKMTVEELDHLSYSKGFNLFVEEYCKI